MAIRLVCFDALHTLIFPRLPVHVQYSQIFAPFLGTLRPEDIKQSFKVALKAVQVEQPSYHQGVRVWWGEVIRRTALGAGANEQALEASLSEIVSILLKRFSSREGYNAFDDAVPTIRLLHNLGIYTAVVSNGDSRIRSVLQDLGFPTFLDPVILSEEEGIEKPSGKIFIRAMSLINSKEAKRPDASNLKPENCLHVGDELVCDYNGAVDAGMNALLLRRSGPEGEQAHKEDDEQMDTVNVIQKLSEVLEWVRERNSR